MILEVYERASNAMSFKNTCKDTMYERALSDPKANRNCLYFDDEGDFVTCYVKAGYDGRGWSVIFCWSATPNILGYYVTWREVNAPMDTRAKFNAKHDRYFASKSIDVCERRAKQRAAKHIANMASRKGADE